MVKSVKVGSEDFRTQKDALDHFRRILHKYRDGERVIDPSDHQDLLALVQRYDAFLHCAGHPTKGAHLASHFQRRRNVGTGWSSPGFWMIRTDGTSTDFSYIEAIRGVSADRSLDFSRACREAVAADLLRAKVESFAKYGDDRGRMACEITQKLVRIEEAHLDHAWPHFSHIVSGFRAARGWSTEVPDGVLIPSADGQLCPKFADPGVREAFVAFHHAQAILRIVSKEANLQTSARARRPKVLRPVQVAKK